MALTRYIMSDSIPSLSAEQPPGTPPFLSFPFFFSFSFWCLRSFICDFFRWNDKNIRPFLDPATCPLAYLLAACKTFVWAKKGGRNVWTWNGRRLRERETVKRVAFLEPNKNLLRFRLPLYSRSNDRPRKKRSLNSSFFAFSSAGNLPCSLFSRW